MNVIAWPRKPASLWIGHFSWRIQKRVERISLPARFAKVYRSKWYGLAVVSGSFAAKPENGRHFFRRWFSGWVYGWAIYRLILGKEHSGLTKSNG